ARHDRRVVGLGEAIACGRRLGRGRRSRGRRRTRLVVMLAPVMVMRPLVRRLRTVRRGLLLAAAEDSPEPRGKDVPGLLGLLHYPAQVQLVEIGDDPVLPLVEQVGDVLDHVLALVDDVLAVLEEVLAFLDQVLALAPELRALAPEVLAFVEEV